MKECIRCHETKDELDFSVNKKCKGGRGNICKACDNERKNMLRKNGCDRVWTVPENNTEVLRTCADCGKEAITQEDLDEFKPRASEPWGVSPQCRKCFNAKNTMESLDGIRADKKRRLKRGTLLRRKYKMTLDDFDEMVEICDDKCQICGESAEGHLHVDHNHDTGHVRGLLCLNCNSGLGKLGDNIDILKRSISYLEKTDKAGYQAYTFKSD